MRASDDEGSALLEFSYLAILLLVPVVYMMLTVFAVQRAAFGASAAAREAGRAYTSGVSAEDARARAVEAARVTMEDHGLPFDPAMVVYPEGAAFAPGRRVVVEIRSGVSLPVVGAFFFGDDEPAIRVTGRHVATLDVFRAT